MRLIIVLVVLLSSGCVLWPSANAPRTGAPATGEPLRVVDDVKIWTSTSRDKVGEVRYEDGSGTTVGRADVYENRQHLNAKSVWFPVQGYEVVSDEDFFRIAGDQSALDRTLARRDSLKRWNRRGKILAVSGVAGVLAAFVVPNPGRTLLLIGGGVAVSSGWYLALWSHQQMKPEYHAVDRSTAVLAADRYNDARGLSASRSF